jgi:hypothetical protein
MGMIPIQHGDMMTCLRDDITRIYATQESVWTKRAFRVRSDILETMM